MYRHVPPQHPRRPNKKNFQFILDQFTHSDIKRWGDIKDLYLRYHWEFYSELAFQRSKISDEIKNSLLEASIKTFTFTRWQRVIKHQYSVEPLSIKGTLVDPGGRFNIGDINPNHFQMFPALYIACDKQTAMQEALCQNVNEGSMEAALDLALTNTSSMTNVSISGKIESYIDLNSPDRLKLFINLFKDFTIPRHVYDIAKILGFPEPPMIIKTVPKLIEAILAPNWREWPMQYDVPVASQIFGQLAMAAGIEGVLYPSKFSKRNNLVIFPQNFDDLNTSLVQLDDPPPRETKVLKWDSASWKKHGIDI